MTPTSLWHRPLIVRLSLSTDLQPLPHLAMRIGPHTHNGALASIAHIAEVPLQSVVTIHHLQCPLPDQPPRTTSVILQHIQDIRPASLECLILVDLELHAHPLRDQPPVAPYITRQVHRVYPNFFGEKICYSLLVSVLTASGFCMHVWFSTMDEVGPSWNWPPDRSLMELISK